MSSTLLALCALLVLAAPAQAASGTRVVHHAMGDFLAGELDGLGVSSTGVLIAAPVSLERFFTPSLYIWSLTLDREGRLIAGAGDDGAVLRKEGDEFVELARLEDQLVMAVAATRNGVLAGTGPEGRVYRVGGGDPDPVVVLQTEATTVWSLAPAADGKSWLAGVGPDAALLRFDPQGKGEGRTIRTVNASVVRHLAREGDRLWMSTEGPSMILQSTSDPDHPDRTRYDGGDAEIPAMVPDGAQGLWFLELSPGDPDMLTPPSTTLLHLHVDGSAERVWSGDIALMSLALAADGALLAGEIGASRVHRITTDGRIGLWRDFGDGDASALLTEGDATWVGSSNLGDIFRLAPPKGGRGTFTSEPVATPAVQKWGRLWVDGSAEDCRFSVRTGIRSEPDDTWSDWSGWKQSGDRIDAPLGDWIQYRVAMQKAEVTGVHFAWARRDHVPRLRGIFFEGSAGDAEYDWTEPESTGYGDSQRELKSSAGLIRGRSQVRVDAMDLDGDELRVSVEVQREGKGTWYPLSREERALRVDWDTTQFEDGLWRARVSGHDAEGATLVSLVSSPVRVDNQPPVLAASKRSAEEFSFTVKDAGARLARVEVRTSREGNFRRVEPVDGVVDGDSEDFVLTLDPEAVAVWIRAVDAAGNEAVFAPGLDR